MKLLLLSASFFDYCRCANTISRQSLGSWCVWRYCERNAGNMGHGGISCGNSAHNLFRFEQQKHVNVSYDSHADAHANTQHNHRHLASSEYQVKARWCIVRNYAWTEICSMISITTIISLYHRRAWLLRRLVTLPSTRLWRKKINILHRHTTQMLKKNAYL